MEKSNFNIAMSLDGYIADPAGGVGYFRRRFGTGARRLFSRFIETVDTVDLGWNTYRQIVAELSPGKWVYEGKNQLCDHPPAGKVRGRDRFTDQEPQNLIDALKAMPGGDIWVCGGAGIAHQLISCRKMDRYHITVIPTLLGDGIRLFARQLRKEDLRLLSVERYNGMVDLIYEPR